MIQEKIDGKPEDFISISGLLDSAGNPVAHAATCKKAQWPRDLGVGVSFDCYTDPTIIQTGLKLTRRLLKRGLFELEIIFDKKKKKWVAIDLNPRSFGQVSLDIARGNDLPILWYEQVMNIKSNHVNDPDRNIEWIHLFPYSLHKISETIQNPSQLFDIKNIIKSAKKRRVDIINDLKDPLPSIPFMLNSVKHPKSLMRQFLLSFKD
jgi:predicted ATP-grasp superfamily ATP-dependent carboligase